MSIDHDTFAERLDDLDDLNEIPDDLAEHARTCALCERRMNLARNIRSTAPHLSTPDAEATTSVADAVLIRTHPPHRRMRVVTMAAAAVAVFAAGGLIVSNFSGTAPDDLAQIADELANSDGIRFVLSSESAVDVAQTLDLEPIDSGDIEQLSTAIPRCEERVADEPTVNDGIDLGPIVEALANNDPCLALELVDDGAQPAVQTYTALATSINQANDNLTQLADFEPATTLEAAAAEQYSEQLRADLQEAERALQELRASFDTLVTTVQPLSEPDTVGSPSGTAVESGLVALRASADTADAAIIDTEPVVKWTQVATGTWTPSSIEISGSVENDSGAKLFTSVEEDPLGIAGLVWSDPNTLIALLQSAPPSRGDIVEWAVPVGVLPDQQSWDATARLDEGRLDELVLRANGTTITITPAR